MSFIDSQEAADLWLWHDIGKEKYRKQRFDAYWKMCAEKDLEKKSHLPGEKGETFMKQAAFEDWITYGGQWPEAVGKDKYGRYILSTIQDAWEAWSYSWGLDNPTRADFEDWIARVDSRLNEKQGADYKYMRAYHAWNVWQEAISTRRHLEKEARQSCTAHDARR